MRRKRRWTGIRTTVIALGLAAATAGGVRAASISTTDPADTGTSTGSTVATTTAATTSLSPILTYHTSVGSSIGTTGVTGTPVISFVSVAGGSFLAPSALSFGKFEVAAPAGGGTTTYKDTPFQITFTADKISGGAIQPNETPIVLSGVLNGTINGDNQSSVVATFSPLAKSVFQTGPYSNSLSLPDSPLHLVPSTTNNGDTTVQAFLTSTAVTAPPPLSNGGTTTVPEPSTVALFAVTLAGLGLRHRSLRRRVAL